MIEDCRSNRQIRSLEFFVHDNLSSEAIRCRGNYNRGLALVTSKWTHHGDMLYLSARLTTNESRTVVGKSGGVPSIDDFDKQIVLRKSGTLETLERLNVKEQDVWRKTVYCRNSCNPAVLFVSTFESDRHGSLKQDLYYVSLDSNGSVITEQICGLSFRERQRPDPENIAGGSASFLKKIFVTVMDFFGLS